MTSKKWCPFGRRTFCFGFRVQKVNLRVTIRFWSLKSKEKVIRPNGHQFWEVIFGWFFGYFTTYNSFLDSKDERKGPTTKQTPVLKSHFWVVFLVNLQRITRFWTLKTKEKVLRPNGHQFWEVVFGWFFGHFMTYNSFWTLKTQQKVLRPYGHQFWEVIFGRSDEFDIFLKFPQKMNLSGLLIWMKQGKKKAFFCHFRTFGRYFTLFMFR